MSTGESDRHTETLAAIEKAYSQWGACLLRFATRLCGNREDAEDIVIETLTHAYLKWDSFHGTSSRRSWLYGIATNRARTNRRRQKLKLEPLTEDLRASSVNALDQVAMEQAINKLPLQQRESFLLVKGEGLTGKEAAEILGRPAGTVLYEVHMAVRFIRDALSPKEGDFLRSSRLCEVEP